jgi:cytidylate kinase
MMAVVTISRQYGSGGNEIAGRVARLLGYHLFDKNLMAQVAAEVALSEDEIVDFSETYYQAQSFLDRLLGLFGTPQFFTGEPGSGAKVKIVEKLDEERTITMVRVTIQAAYQHKNVVMVGRGGQVILQDRSDVLHVRLEAPLSARVERIQNQSQIDPKEAQKLISQYDKASANYLKRFYNVDWSDPMLYHLIINTGKWDIEAATHFIVDGVRYLSATKSSS